MKTRRLTVAQAVVEFLANQYSERDGVERRFFPGVFGIFGHGNVAGLGQALQQAGDQLPLLPGAERAGHGPHRRRLREDGEPPGHLRLHHLDRARAPPTW